MKSFRIFSVAKRLGIRCNHFPHCWKKEEKKITFTKAIEIVGRKEQESWLDSTQGGRGHEAEEEV